MIKARVPMGYAVRVTAPLICYPHIPLGTTGRVTELVGHKAFEIRVDGGGPLIIACMEHLDRRQDSEPEAPLPAPKFRRREKTQTNVK